MKLVAAIAALSLFSASCKKEEYAIPRNAPADSGLDAWSHVLVDDGKKEDVWSIEDGVVICQGEPLGYLQTKESYQDFKLTFDWRWPEGKEPGNSGVFFRINSEPNGFMPQCVEAQLKSGSAGDLWAFFGAKVEGENPVEIKDHEALKDFHGTKATKNVEKPVGEWNQYEITVKGDTVDLKINGEVVNQGTGLDEVSGPIGFQSEGAEIHLRNIQIESL